MLVIVKGRPIEIDWYIFKGANKQAEDFSQLDSGAIKMFLIGPSNKGDDQISRFNRFTYEVNVALDANNKQYLKIDIDDTASALLDAGIYDIKVVWVKNSELHLGIREGNQHLSESKISGIFAITSDSSEDNTRLDSGVTAKKVLRSFVEPTGYDGLSAYEIAVMHGYTEDEQTWSEEYTQAEDRTDYEMDETKAGDGHTTRADEKHTPVEEWVHESWAHKVEVTWQDNEDTRQSNESTRQDNEDTRKSNEGIGTTDAECAAGSRRKNESIRVDNETTRQSQEGTRQGNETTRGQKETARQKAEGQLGDTDPDYATSRVKKELDRQSAESARQTAEGSVVLPTSEETHPMPTSGSGRLYNEAVRQHNEDEREAAESERQSTFETNEGTKSSSTAGDDSRWGDYKEQEGTLADSASGDSDRWGQYKEQEGTLDSSEADDGSRWGQYKEEEGTEDSSYIEHSRWGNYHAAEITRGNDYSEAEGSYSGSTSGDSSRWGYYKLQEGANTDAANASGSRWARYNAAEAGRGTLYEAAEGTSESSGDGSRWATFNANEATRNNGMAPLVGIFDCSTAAATAQKEVTASNYVLTNGGAFKIKFTYANSASSPTLKINSETAKAIVFNGAVASASNTWGAGEVVEFYYDPSYNSNAGGFIGRSTVVTVSQNTQNGGYDLIIGNNVVNISNQKDVQNLNGYKERIINDYYKIDGNTTPSDEISGKYITENGNLGNLSNASVLVYEVSENDLFYIQGYGGSGSRIAKFAFYSSDEFESSNAIYVQPYSDEVTEYKIIIPKNVHYLAVSRYQHYGIAQQFIPIISNSEINAIAEQILSIQEFDENVEKELSVLKKELYVLGNELIPSDTINDKYINNQGNQATLSNCKINVYEVAEGDLVRIQAFGSSGSQLAQYALYSSDVLQSSNVVYIQPSGNTNKTYDILIPQGAHYLAINRYDNVGYVKPLESKISQIQEFNELVFDKGLIKEYIDSEVLQSQNGYINGSGDFTSLGSESFEVKEFGVTPGKRIKIINTNHAGVSMMYAFYQNSFCNTLIQKGPLVASISYDSVEIVVPKNANYVCVSSYLNSAKVQDINIIDITDFYNEVENYINNGNQTDFLNLYAYQKDGENIYIAYNKNGNETCYWFKKCMANNLYTFYRVGFRSVNRVYPSTDGIASWSGITTINSVSSDNIGPLFISSPVSSWVGGNHHYPSESADPKYLTASNDSYELYVDNKLITANQSGLGHNVEIKVHNIIYDPKYAPAEGATSLSVKLCDEFVSYQIHKNNIEVGLKHKFADSAEGVIGTYYGMQSFCTDENYYITPRGSRKTWKPCDTTTSDSFTKGSYPNFNRFIEKNSNGGYYQSAYLLTDFSLGTHVKISDSDAIFLRGSSKCYHHLIANLIITSGMVTQWAGVYTFFSDALLDNDDVFAYMGVVRGKDTLFINSKRGCALSIPIPANLLLNKMSIVENTGFVNELNGNTFNIGGDGLYIVCENEESMIVEFD